MTLQGLQLVSVGPEGLWPRATGTCSVSAQLVAGTSVCRVSAASNVSFLASGDWLLTGAVSEHVEEDVGLLLEHRVGRGLRDCAVVEVIPAAWGRERVRRWREGSS